MDIVIGVTGATGTIYAVKLLETLNDINGIKSEEEKIDDNIKVDRVFIINEEGEKAIGKPKGRYVTIDIKKLKIARRRRNSKIGRCNNNRIKKNSR